MVAKDNLAQLKDILGKGKVVILGVGNPLMGDDGVGSWIAEELKGKVNLPVFVGEDVPENYLYDILAEEPSWVIVVDAVNFGGEAGEIRLINIDELTPRFLSSHGMSLNIMASILKEKGCEVILLGVQPKTLVFMEEMSEEVKRSGEEIISLIRSWSG
ncbi:MAG: hydrogenase 3 maturation endopeptidase HyCI [bacterium]